MKNIHLIPTDKPSRLCINGKNQMHIYITSDEEIKVGDWYISTHETSINQCSSFNKEILNKAYWAQKIILTTDPELIKDGVQAIDDEFLEWFVKNPSCEKVKVLNKVDFFSKINDKLIYKIIIPQEEPKQETLTYTEAVKKEERIFNSTMMSKQETLEEAAENYVMNESDATLKLISKYSFKDGAKWQAERMYSEQEVESLLHRFMQSQHPDWHGYSTTKWFEQFKKNRVN